MLCPVRLPPLLLDLGLAKGEGVSGYSSIVHERASVSATPSGAGEGEVARSQRTSPARTASSVASPCSSQHARRRDESREVSVDRSLSRSSRVSRSSDRGTRKDRKELALGRTALVTVAVVLALAPLTVHGQEVESVGGGHPLGRCPPASDHDLRIAPALWETSLDTGLAGTALGVTASLLITTGHVDSVRVPPLAGELAVTQSPLSFS